MATVEAMRQRLHGLWIVATLAYAGVRILLAEQFLADYGLNVAVFAAIELVSSAVFGLASGHFVRNVIDRVQRNTKAWGGLTLLGYLTPDIYVFASTRHLPGKLFVVLVVFVIVSLVVSAVGIARRIREGAEQADNLKFLAAGAAALEHSRAHELAQEPGNEHAHDADVDAPADESGTVATAGPAAGSGR